MACSNMHSISLQYGPPDRGMHSEATAYTGWYDDPGISVSESSHDDIKSVVDEVVRDMGFPECELHNKLEVIEALLGDNGRQFIGEYIHGSGGDNLEEGYRRRA